MFVAVDVAVAVLVGPRVDVAVAVLVGPRVAVAVAVFVESGVKLGAAVGVTAGVPTTCLITSGKKWGVPSSCDETDNPCSGSFLAITTLSLSK